MSIYLKQFISPVSGDSQTKFNELRAKRKVKGLKELEPLYGAYSLRLLIIKFNFPE